MINRPFTAIVAWLIVATVSIAAETTRIQVKRGKEAQLPTKAAMGEPLFTTDTHRVFFGYSTGMEELLQRARFQGYTAAQAERMIAIWSAMDGKQGLLGYTPVDTTDTRLSDARTPLSHTQDASTVNGLSTVATSGSYLDLLYPPTIPVVCGPDIDTGIYDGRSASITIGTVAVGAPGSGVIITDTGLPINGKIHDSIFNFTIPSGANGTNGTNGTNGVTPTISVGTVSGVAYNVSPTITDSGTPPNAIFNFSIPQGLPGAQGPKGDPGASASVDQESVLASLAAPGGRSLFRMPLAPQTDDDALIEIGDLNENTTLWITGRGLLVVQHKSGNRLLSFNPVGSEFSVKSSSGRSIFSASSSASNSAGAPGGSNRQLQYNNNGVMAGAPFARYSATGTSGTLIITGGMILK